jgi:hypothetical protein
MGHISELALLDHLAGKGELTVQESEHLQDCADCRELAVTLRGVIEDSGNVDQARRALGEAGTSSSAIEAPEEIQAEQRALDGRPERKRA